MNFESAVNLDLLAPVEGETTQEKVRRTLLYIKSTMEYTRETGVITGRGIVKLISNWTAEELDELSVQAWTDEFICEEMIALSNAAIGIRMQLAASA